MSNNDDNSVIDVSFFRNMVDNILDILIVVELDGTVCYINSRINDLLGYLPEYFKGLNIFHFVHPKDYPKFSQEIKRSRRLNIPLSIEYRLKHKDGHYVPVCGRGTFYDANGTTKVISVISDISERKKYEQELDKYKFIVESAQDAIFYKDLASRYVIANSITVNAFGLSREEVLGKNDLDLMSNEEEAKKNIEDDQVLFRTKKPLEIIKKMTGKNGKEFWFHAKKVPHFNADGELDGLIGIARDISERKRAELQLRESERKYRHLFEESPYSIVLLNNEGLIIDCNSRIKEIFGYSKDEILERDFREIFKMPQESSTIVLENFNKLTKGVVPKPIEVQFFTRNNKLLWRLLQGSIIQIKDNTKIQVIGQDITERKEAESKLIESEAKFRNAYNRAELYKDLFAHDMNNILQNILSGVQLSRFHVNKKTKINEISNILNIMQEEVNRGVNLVSNIRKLSKIKENDFLLEPSEIFSVLKSSINVIKHRSIERKLDISINTPYERAFINANELLGDIFHNILSNAVQYNKNPIAQVEIKISRKQGKNRDYIKMEFIDNGIGIDDASKSSIFLRSERKNEGVRGMGLGLSLVKQIVELYDGQIYVENGVEGDHTKGSNFILLFPEVNDARD